MPEDDWHEHSQLGAKIQLTKMVIFLPSNVCVCVFLPFSTHIEDVDEGI